MASWLKPTDSEIDRIIARLGTKANRERFFNELQNPEWLEPLRARGFFKAPPAPVRDEKSGGVVGPRWPQADYLVRMASLRPEKVAQIIEKIPDNGNSTVYWFLIRAMLGMPASVANPFVKRVVKWVRQEQVADCRQLGQLISHLAKSGEPQAALELARCVLLIRRDMESGAFGGVDITPAYWRLHDYGELLASVGPVLVVSCGVKALEVLCGLLECSVTARWEENESAFDDGLCRFVPAIEHGSRRHALDVSESLVGAVRSAAKQLCELPNSGAAPVDEIVRRMEQREGLVFKRLVFWLLSEYASDSGSMVEERLTNREYFDDWRLQHEYELLAKSGFQTISNRGRAMVLDWIEIGPNLGEWAVSVNGVDPTEEQVQDHADRWRRDRLAPIKDHLPAEWRERFNNWEGRLGEANYPFLAARTESRWGRASPKSSQEIERMTVDEILTFVRDWDGPVNGWEASRGGLSDELRTAIKQSPGRFIGSLERFAELDRVYAQAVVQALTDVEFNIWKVEWWDAAVGLLEKLAERASEVDDATSNASSCSGSFGIAPMGRLWLLGRGLRSDRARIPLALRERVWGLIEPLTHHPSPSQEDEQKRDERRDWPVVALNSTRSVAIRTAIEYGLWIRSQQEAMAIKADDGRSGFGDMPELKTVLDDHLLLSSDPSLAVRSVYGQWFPWICTLDVRWAEEHAEHVFSERECEQDYWLSAWEAYVQYCQPYSGVFKVIERAYRRAVEALKTGAAPGSGHWRPEERLAEHLMTLYGRGLIGQDSDLLSSFFKNAAPWLSGHAIAFVGRSLSHEKERIPEDVVQRFRRLWEKRIRESAVGVRDTNDAELLSFGLWFASDAFDEDWALGQLSAVLEVTKNVDPEWGVLEKLAKSRDASLPVAIECLALLCEGMEPWTIDSGADHVRSLLRRTLGMGDKGLWEAGRSIVNQLLRRGFRDFKTLLRESGTEDARH